MKYEIKVARAEKDGRNGNWSYIATEVELTEKNGLEVVKFKKEGKSRYTWFEIPNDYQMKKYVDKFELVITEATTGRRIYTISK